MNDLEKRVFISYRRSSSGYLPQAIFLYLQSQGYDVFLDVRTINSGTFDTNILHQISGRQDFIVILAPGSLERCLEPDDWFRREIETAIKTRRNIIPIFDQGFTFRSEEKFLTGTLGKLTRYNGIEVKPQSFMEDVEKLHLRFLSAPNHKTGESPINILIVDDHPLFRDGLQQALSLEDDIVVIGQSEDGEDALRTAQKLQPDVVLMDINLPLINGLQVTRQLKAKYSQIAIITLTAYHDENQVLHAMQAGASAYCSKDVTPEELIEIIREVAQGTYIIAGERMDEQGVTIWIQSSIEAMSGSYIIDAEEHFIPLSPREMEILQFVTNGLSNKEIAVKLRISQQVVKNHMTSILRKLNVEDRTQAAVNALRRGWVKIQPANHEESTASPTIQPQIPNIATSDKPLTKRQQEIQRLIEDKLDIEEIAQKLGISRSTVRKHMAAISSKTNH